MRIISFVVLFLFSQIVFAVTNDELIRIYYDILVKNNIKHFPKLYITYDMPHPDACLDGSGRRILFHPELVHAITKNQAAMILGHELGHYLNGDGGKKFPGNKKQIIKEYAADKTGKRLAIKANYNMCEAANYILTYPISDDHPHPVARYNRFKCK